MTAKRKIANAKPPTKTPAKPYEPTLREKEVVQKVAGHLTMVPSLTLDAVAYVGGLRRYRGQVNNDGGAVPIWELAQNNPSNGGFAA